MLDLIKSSAHLGSAPAVAAPKNNRKQAQIANRLRVLRLVYSSNPYSQRRIAMETALQASTVSNIIAELIQSGIVTEGESQESGRVGPREVTLRINPAAAFTAGINLHAGQHEVCIFDGEGKVLAEDVYEEQWTDKTFGRLPKWLAAVARRAGLGVADLRGVGVAVPGIVNHEHGVVTLSRALRLENFPIRERLQRELKLPVFADRNVNCGSYYERHMNPDEYWENAGYFMIKRHGCTGDDVHFSYGLAITVNGNLYRGVNDAAGELDTLLSPPQESPGPQRNRGGEADSFFDHMGSHLAAVINLLDIGNLIIASDGTSMEYAHYERLCTALETALIPITDRRLALRYAGEGVNDISKGAGLCVLHSCLEASLMQTILSAAKA